MFLFYFTFALCFKNIVLFHFTFVFTQIYKNDQKEQYYGYEIPVLKLINMYKRLEIHSAI